MTATATQVTQANSKRNYSKTVTLTRRDGSQVTGLLIAWTIYFVRVSVDGTWTDTDLADIAQVTRTA